MLSDDRVILIHLYSIWTGSYIWYWGGLGSDSRCFLLAWPEIPHLHEGRSVGTAPMWLMATIVSMRGLWLHDRGLEWRVGEAPLSQTVSPTGNKALEYMQVWSVFSGKPLHQTRAYLLLTLFAEKNETSTYHGSNHREVGKFFRSSVLPENRLSLAPC